jgi:hypothetical protein
MGNGSSVDRDAMTSTTHQGDMFKGERLRRALTDPRLRRALTDPRLRSRAVLAQGLAPLAALSVLVLLLQHHGLSWLAGMVAGASATIWLVGLRSARRTAATSAVPDSDAATRDQLSLVESAGWVAVHGLDARFGHYQHVAIGPGGVVSLHSRRLEQPRDVTDPASQREIVQLRRGALTAAANLRDDIEQATGRPAWVQAVVVVWSDFPAGCVQDGRCVFVAGPRLIDWLQRRPGQLAPERAAEIADALEQLAHPVAALASAAL